ncbi:hypothetical protein JMJ35_009852 [Cladonia borealis]|uniref:Uncharacterized protein n=1 Tax=Cladonia borealis TaxID=184061 RepID=A0AA39QRS0_9LECA|nr:hypothetical protein JMJ35_009852 [Cladonia borealis]
MCITDLLLLFLIITLSKSSSASLLSTSSDNQDESQHTLKRIAGMPLPSIEAPSNPWIGRCPQLFQWQCYYLPDIGVYCACTFEPIQNFKSAYKSNMISPSYTDITAQLLAQAQNTTTLEVLVEVQPGNAETLVSSFALRCEKGRQHIACRPGGCGFVCGCHDNWSTAAGMHDHKEEELGKGNEETREEVPEDNCNRDSNMEPQQSSKHSDFKFQKYRFPHCKEGTNLMCCVEDLRSVCFCAGNEQHCEIF